MSCSGRRASGRRSIYLAFIVCVAAGAQTPQEYALRVNGSLVPASRPGVRMAGEWFVPLAAVAKAMGSEVTIDIPAQSVRVLRSDGSIATYDAATGRILQGLVMAGDVKNFRQVQLNVGLENLMFPVSGVVALLGAIVREDPDHDVLEIDSMPPANGSGSAGQSFHPASSDYRYGLATNGETWQQLIDLRGDALLGARQLTAALEFGQGSGAGAPSFRQGYFRMELDSQSALTAGDQSSHSSVEALNNTVRGLGYEWRWGQFHANAYAGLGVTSTSSSLGNFGVPKYGGKIAGFGLARNFGIFDLSLAANFFDGDGRSGATFSAGYSGLFARNQFKLQGLAGDFSGFSLRPVLALAPGPLDAVVEVDVTAQHVQGAAYGFSLADSFTPFQLRRLWLTGLWERYSRNFLVLREDASYSAVSREFLSATLQPSRYFSFTGGVRDSTALLGNPDLGRGYSYGASASTPGSSPVQFSYFRSTQIGDSLVGRFDLSQYSTQLPRLSRYSAGATYTEVRFQGQLERSVSATLSADYARFGRVGLHDQLQLRNAHSYGVDWSRQFGDKGAYLLIGLERQNALDQRSIISPTVAFRIPLPRKQSLTLTYATIRGSRLLQFQIGGPILRPRELLKEDGRTLLVVRSSLIGQVYQDVNQDGKFEPGIDRPILRLEVWLDEEKSALTDAAGYFRFDDIAAGTHRVRAAIASLPASLILANDDLMVAVMPYRENRQDILAFQSGQIMGRVTLTRMDEAGTEQQQPFPDARIIVTGDRDTFSEADGAFVIGDLPPGAYSLRVDPATVPAGFAGNPATQTVQVKPGGISRDVDFHLLRKVIEKAAPARP